MTPSESNSVANLTNRLVATRYDVLEPLGDGVLVAAYRSRDRLQNRIVTLKMPRAPYASREDVRSLLREGLGRVLGLSHPAITRVYDVGEVGDFGESAGGASSGLFYFAEEYVRGIDLGERIRRVATFQPLAATEAVISVAEALEYALTRGVAHGDVRPENVLVGTAAGAEGNGVKLTGFGVALAQARAIADDPTALRRVVPYRAPEVSRDSAPNVAADVYALGVVLYELLTGAPPFGGAGENAFEIVAQHAEAPVPSPSAANGSVPSAFDNIVARAMAKRQEDRYPSATEMLRDLRAIRDSLRHGKMPSPIGTIAPLSRPPVAAASFTGEPDLLAPLAPATATPPVATSLSAAEPDDPYRNSATGTAVAPISPSASERLRERAQQKSTSVDTSIATNAPLFARAAVPATAAVAPPVAGAADRTDNRRAPGVTPAPASTLTGEEEVPLKRRHRGDEDGEGRGGSRYLTSINLVLVLLVLAGIGFLFWQFSSMFRPGQDVIVPNLVGKTTTDARALASQEKFDLAVVDEQYRDNDPVDVIYQMQPAAGRHIREGKSVEIWVSKGPHMVPVPDVTTKSLDDARQVLVANNLKEGDRTGEFDPFTPKGDVIRQAPEGGGMAPRGSKVSLVVSKGEEPSPPPDAVPTAQPEPTDTPVAPPAPDNPTPPAPTPTAVAATPSSGPTPDMSISPNKHRAFNITFTVPKDNLSHHVRIDVTDRDGTRTVYDETLKGGEKIRPSIEAVGRGIHFRIFDNDVLSKEQTI